MLKAAATPARATRLNNGMYHGNYTPYSNMQTAPNVDNMNESTSAKFSPSMRYQRPPRNGPTISEAAEANAFMKISPGRNLS